MEYVGEFRAADDATPAGDHTLILESIPGLQLDAGWAWRVCER